MQCKHFVQFIIIIIIIFIIIIIIIITLFSEGDIILSFSGGGVGITA